MGNMLAFWTYQAIFQATMEHDMLQKETGICIEFNEKN